MKFDLKENLKEKTIEIRISYIKRNKNGYYYFDGVDDKGYDIIGFIDLENNISFYQTRFGVPLKTEYSNAVDENNLSIVSEKAGTINIIVNNFKVLPAKYRKEKYV